MKYRLTRIQSTEGLGGFGRQEWTEESVIETSDSEVPVGAEPVADDMPLSGWQRKV